MGRAEDSNLRELIEAMVRLLITYEIELTSYQTVYDALRMRLSEEGIDIDIRKMLRIVAHSGSLEAEAEAEYAAFFGLTREVTPDAVEGALRSIRQTITNRNSRDGREESTDL
ncbi:MAG: hypothetical protein WBW84_00150 [Acidobacteriaceae bacterium]